MPAARIAALRIAFQKTMARPELQAEARKMNIDAEPTLGEQLHKLIVQMYATQLVVFDGVRKAMGP